jgi:DMSO/TMAO reductase YedYZ molybdopterin-dependent catalytic subunit
MHDPFDQPLAQDLSRRRLLALGAAGAGALALPASSQAPRQVDLRLPGGPSLRPVTTAFPGKGPMILQRTNPPLLETPMPVFDRDIITPADQFYVRWHWSDIPTSIDTAGYRLAVAGHVASPLALPLAALLRLPRVEVVAVNQCSGNSRGYFQPRVPGAQWGHGAMGNARWSGVRLRDVLDMAGVRPGAVVVRFGGRDKALLPDAPSYEKALGIDHARDGEVMIAFAMNGAPLPMLNGFPLRLVVPGWFSTYWVKALDRIEVLTSEDDRFWTAKAYRIPTTPGADVAPGAKDYPTEPINRMIPRAWVTSHAEGAVVPAGRALQYGGIAMGGDAGVARVDVSSDGGRSWRPARLGSDLGRYSFRRWTAVLDAPAPGPLALLARATSSAGVTQPMRPIWNPSGYLRGNVELTTLRVGGAA